MTRKFLEFDNVVYRHIFVEKASAEELEEIDKAFWMGNWSVFGAWARMVLKDRNSSKDPGIGSPHADLVRKLLPPYWDDSKIRFLLRAQLANLKFRNISNLKGPDRCPDSLKRLIVTYLQSFKEVRRGQIIGNTIVDYSHFPDERIVRLAGYLKLTEVIPDLLRFLKVPRYFYHISMDAPHRSEEIDGLFQASLNALILMEGAKTHLEEALAQLDEEEKIIWDEEFHNNYDGSSSRGTETKVLAENNSSIRTKRQWLALALDALGDEMKMRKLLGYNDDQVFLWSREGLDGPAFIEKDSIWHIGNFTINQYDLKTGNIRRSLSLQGREGDRGMDCYSPVMTPGGVLAASLNYYGEDMKLVSTEGDREWKVIILNPDTGEVEKTFNPAFEPRSVKMWSAGDIIVFFSSQGKKVWAQNTEGDLLWDRDLENTDMGLVDFADGHVGILGKDCLEILKPDGSEVLKIEEIGKDMVLKSRLDEVLIGYRGKFYYVLARGQVLAYDDKGKLLWFKTSRDSGGVLSDKQALRNGGYMGWSSNGIFRVSRDGVVEDQKLSLGNHKVLLNEKEIYSLRERRLTKYSKDEEIEITLKYSNARMLDLGENELVLWHYDNGYFISVLKEAEGER